MKEYNEFKQDLIQEINNKTNGSYRVTNRHMQGNNGSERDYIVIEDTGRASDAKPAFRIEQYFDQYKDGETISEIADRIIENSTAAPGFIGRFTGQMYDYDKVRDRIIIRLVNAKANEKLLKTIPNIPFADLAIVFYVMFDTDDAQLAACRIDNNIAERWQVDVNELYETALKNTPRLLEAAFRGGLEVIKDILEEYVGKEAAEAWYTNAVGNCEKVPFYILSNKLSVGGAAAVLYPGVLKEASAKLGGDLTLIPSSVHEFLVMPANDVPDNDGSLMDKMNEMIRSINRDHVKPEEVLSDHTYIYHADSDSLECA